MKTLSTNKHCVAPTWEWVGHPCCLFLSHHLQFPFGQQFAAHTGILFYFHATLVIPSFPNGMNT